MSQQPNTTYESLPPALRRLCVGYTKLPARDRDDIISLLRLKLQQQKAKKSNGGTGSRAT